MATEIDDIRAGRWDNKIAQELGISSQETDIGANESQESTDLPPVDVLDTVEASALQDTVGTDEQMLENDSDAQIQA